MRNSTEGQPVIPDNLPEDVNISPPLPENEIKPVKRVKKEDVNRVKNKMHHVVEDLREGKSLFARMAMNWGPRPFWIKALIGLGILLFLLPFIALPILIPEFPLLIVAAGLAVTGIVFLGYCIVSWFMDNHYKSETPALEKLDAGIDDAVDLYGDMALDLQEVNDKAREEVETLAQENKRFDAELDDLAQKKQKYESNNQQYSQINKSLQLANTRIAITSQQLTLTLKEKEQLLDLEKQRREQDKIQHEKAMQDMQEELNKTKSLNNQLEGHLEKTQATCRILAGSAEEMQKLQTDFHEKSEQNAEKMAKITQKQSSMLGKRDRQFADNLSDMQDLNAQQAEQTKKYEALVDKKGALLERFSLGFFGRGRNFGRELAKGVGDNFDVRRNTCG